jgi:hypothetical protein
MKFGQLKQYLIETEHAMTHTVYEVPDDECVITVRADENTYEPVTGGIILLHGGVELDYPEDLIRFYWRPWYTNKASSFAGPNADDIEVDVRMYKLINREM